MSTPSWWAVYTRCPRCRLLCPNSMHDPYFGGTVATEPDWDRAESGYLRCADCGEPRTVTAAQREPADASSACPSCTAPTPHPATADLARCLACGLLFRVRPAPKVVRVRSGLARVAFDGSTVILTRLWCPVPRWRHRRITLDRIDGASYYKPGSDNVPDLMTWFVVHLRNGESRALWLWAFRPRSARNQRFEAMSETIHEAVAGRIRLLVKHSVGLGPWSETVWKSIEERFPEVHELAEGPHGVLGGRRPRSHREMAAEDLGAMRGERDSRVPGYPRRVPGLPSLDHAPSSGSYPAGAVWLATADQLAASSDVTTTTGWRQMTAVLLSYGHHWTTVTRRR